MTDLRTAAQQALEALEEYQSKGAPFLACDGAVAALRAALAQQADPTDPGNDVDVLREHVRHLERRVRELHAQQAEPVAGKVVAWGVFANIDGEWQLQHPVFAGDEQGKVNAEFERASYSGPQPLEVRPLGVVTATAQQAEPELSRCPQCNGPADNGFDRSFPPSPYLCKKCMAEPVGPGAWVASPDGRVIYDDVSADDGLLRVSGDFENDEQRIRYAQQIVDKLNAAPPQRTMVPLTEEEIDALPWNGSPQQFARAVEKASWEKNHGQA